MYIAYTEIQYNSKTLFREIANWCMRFCCSYKQDLEEKIETLRKTGGIDSQAYRSLERQMDKICKYDIRYNSAPASASSIYIYQDCICDLLEDMLPDMLPQDLLQKQVESLFTVYEPT